MSLLNMLKNFDDIEKDKSRDMHYVPGRLRYAITVTNEEFNELKVWEDFRPLRKYSTCKDLVEGEIGTFGTRFIIVLKPESDYTQVLVENKKLRSDLSLYKAIVECTNKATIAFPCGKSLYTDSVLGSYAKLQHEISKHSTTAVPRDVISATSAIALAIDRFKYINNNER